MGAPNCMNIYFRISDSRTDDGQKFIGGITDPELTTVDGQKIIRGIIKAEERQRPAGGAKRLQAEGRPSPKSPNVTPLVGVSFCCLKPSCIRV